MKSPKYFKYFIANVIIDCLLIAAVFIFTHQLEKLIIVLGLWVTSKVIHYPQYANRRYVSYSNFLLLLIKQFFSFCLGYFIISLFLHQKLEPTVLYDLIYILIALTVSIISFLSFVRFYRYYGYGYNNIIVVSGEEERDVLINSLQGNQKAANRIEKIFKKVNLNEIESIIKSKDINEIYCTSSSVSESELSVLMHSASKHNVNLYIVSFDQFKKSSNNIPFDSLLNYSLEIYPLLDSKNLILKRMVDIIISFLVIVFILSWLIPILGILIKLESKGSVFFLQPRAGKNGKYFLCFKFRSMHTSKNTSQASKNDSRITKVGKFIRKTSLDEFPQFINALLGQMSIVGPRPHIKSLNDKFDAEVNLYNHRFLVKPGITGLSQITGHRGETKDNQTMHNRIRLDVLYIKNWSIGLDLIIIFRTVKTLFVPDQEVY